ADRDRMSAGLVEAPVIGLDIADTGLVVHRFGQRHVAEIMHPRHLEGGDIVDAMGTAVIAGLMAHGAGPEMLVALGRAVAGAVRHADQRDIAGGRILIPGAAEQGRDAPPIPALAALLCCLKIVLCHFRLPRMVCLSSRPLWRYFVASQQ